MDFAPMQTLAGIVVFLYAVSSILGLWLSAYVQDALANGRPLPEPLHDTPKHHLDLMMNYGSGLRSVAWRISIAALVTCLIALAFSNALAFWALGIALGIDALLFITCKNIGPIMTQTSPNERLFDVLQGVALLVCFTLLFWLTQSQVLV
jgi:hypothetical protein